MLFRFEDLLNRAYLEREKALYAQLDDLHQNYLTTRNTKLQKLKVDIDKDSHELGQTDPTHWTPADRQRLSHHWVDLQRRLDDQHVDFIYKPTSSNHSPLGDLHLKTPNQVNEHLQPTRTHRPQVSLLDPFDNQEAVFRSNPVSEILHCSFVQRETDALRSSPR